MDHDQDDSRARMQPDPPIGERIAYYRRRRGLSQEVCAGLVGRTGQWLSQIERGVRPIDRLSMLIELTRVLRVNLVDLIGRPVPVEPTSKPLSFVESLRVVLMRYGSVAAALGSNIAEDAKGSDLTLMRRRVHEANRLYQAAHYSATGELLTGLVVEAQQATHERQRGDDRRMAYSLLAMVYHATAKTLSKVGEPSLAWIVAERAAVAAEESDDQTLIGASAYHLGQALLNSGYLEDSITIVTTAANALEQTRHSASPEHQSTVGGLYLTGALASAKSKDRRETHHLLDRAADYAREDRNDLWLAFGPANVQIHRLASAVELDDPRDAIRQGEAVDPESLLPELLGRRAQVLIELSRAYLQRRLDSQATEALTYVNHKAPELLRVDPIIHWVVRQLVARARGKMSTELRSLVASLDEIR